MSQPDGSPSSSPRYARWGVLFAAVWLVFLADPATRAWQLRGEPAGWVGGIALIGFGLTYLAVFVRLRSLRMRMVTVAPTRWAVAVLATMVALCTMMVWALGQSATAGAVYIVVAAVMSLSFRAAVAATVLAAVTVEVLAEIIPGWERALGLSFAVCAAASAMFGIQQMMLRNIALVRAQEENTRLVAERERNRFARDLHDILGHSLTVITVKSELAARVFDTDPERARAELTDLERLSRDALADVRRAVEGYRELSLAGELARAREALLAAGIEADLPSSVDDVPTDLRELFAWTIREGVTNVIRHSGATRCTVRMSARHVQVGDNGAATGASWQDGHGLAGLRERAASTGAVLSVSAPDPRGFLLEVTSA